MSCFHLPNKNNGMVIKYALKGNKWHKLNLNGTHEKKKENSKESMPPGKKDKKKLK